MRSSRNSLASGFGFWCRFAGEVLAELPAVQFGFGLVEVLAELPSWRFGSWVEFSRELPGVLHFGLVEVLRELPDVLGSLFGAWIGSRSFGNSLVFGLGLGRGLLGTPWVLVMGLGLGSWVG